MVSGLMLGVTASKRLDNRQKFLRQYISFINQIKTQIEYNGSSLAVIFSLCNVDKPFSVFVSDMINNLDSNNTFINSWNNSVGNLDKSLGLKSDDISIINEFGQGLGISDITGQISHCNLHSALAEEHYQDAKDCMTKKSKLYKTMGLMLGIAISIVII